MSMMAMAVMIATRLFASRKADGSMVAMEEVDERGEEQEEEDADDDADHDVLVLEGIAGEDGLVLERAGAEGGMLFLLLLVIMLWLAVVLVVLRPGRQGRFPVCQMWRGYSEAPGWGRCDSRYYAHWDKTGVTPNALWVGSDLDS